MQGANLAGVADVLHQVWARLGLLLALVLGCSPAQAADFAVGNYVLKSSTRLSSSDFELTYTVVVASKVAAQKNVIGTVQSINPDTVVKQGNVTFGDIADNGTANSQNNLVLRQKRTKRFNPNDLVWTVAGTPASGILAGFIASPSTGNAPLTVRFTPTPVTTNAIVRFEWDLDGDGRIDVNDPVGRNVTTTYNTAGTYAATLKITDSDGRVDTRTVTIVVGTAPPVVTASAQPSNGAIPLAVAFQTTVVNADAVASYEWDFLGDGVYGPKLTTGGNTSYTYTAAGVFTPKLRVTDKQGVVTIVAVPTMVVRPGPTGSPRVTLSVAPSTGNAPLASTLTATVVDPQSKAVQSYEWDADGDGVFDGTTTASRFSYTYGAAGTFYPRVRVTMSDGRTAEDVALVTPASTLTLRLGSDTIDAQAPAPVVVTTVLGAATKLSLVVERRGGGVVRTLLPTTTRAAGTYTDPWDGKSDGGQYVPEGVYQVVALYTVDGVVKRYDLSTTTGGDEFNPPRTSIPSTFEPYNNRPLTIDFTLARAAEVTAFMGSYNVDTRYVTFYTRQGFGKGTYRITWSGDSASGQLIKPGPGDQFLFGIFGYTLPDNGIFVRNGVQLSDLSSAPAIYDPTAVTAASTVGTCAVSFKLSLPASAELVVQDAATGTVVRRMQFDNLATGTNTVAWDGKANDGRFVAPGTYRLAVVATQSNGFRSLTSFTLQRVFY
jgi:PKD repeat protein/flagellar hook assembly protein FlgD